MNTGSGRLVETGKEARRLGKELLWGRGPDLQGEALELRVKK